MGQKEERMNELQKLSKKCKAMAAYAKKNGDGLLQTFYENAKKGFDKKLFRIQVQ
ncbi:MAG: hypothetical protein IIZ93_08950 [Acidaminococcaceae bacterium]|nr:hypothetical protein [Acidaminococcaceae bacterium]